MKADNISLLEFIGAGKRTFYIPVYQRNYDWKKLQCVTLFQDIVRIAKDENQNSHFLGLLFMLRVNHPLIFVNLL